MWQSSNPALNNNDAFSQFYGKDMFASRDLQAKANVTTVEGVVNKTAILVGVAVTCGALGYWLVGQNTSVLLISNVAAFVIALGIGFKLRGSPAMAPVLAPIYAAVEGVFLGALTGAVETMLANQGIKATGGVALQAFIITASVLIAMLGLYKAGIVRPTNAFKAVVCTATGAIFLVYLISWPLALIFNLNLPLIGWSSAFQDSGMVGWIGLGVNVLILGVASLWLVIDFAEIEEKVAQGAPKHMEWYCGYALLVTLAWIYYEAVKLVVRLAVLLSDRE